MSDWKLRGQSGTSMKIITVCSHTPTESYYRPDAFFASCRRFGHEPVVLGQGGSYGGLGSKLRLLKQLLDSTPSSLNGVMIFCDSFDVVFQSDPINALNHFRLWAGSVRMIFNAERALFPFNEEVEQGHPQSETSYRFLNSGFIIGETETFRKCLELMNADKIPDDHQRDDQTWVHPNDQELWQRLYVAERKSLGLALDTRAEICMTLANVLPEELDFDGELISNNETTSTPVAIHVNGRKEEWWPLILGKLGL